MPARRLEHAFYIGMAILLVGIVFAGFAPTFYLRPASSAPLPPFLVVHGTLFSSWMVLLVAQTALAAGGRVDLHRRIGVAGALVAGAVVVVGTLTALLVGRRDSSSMAGLRFLIVPLGDMVAFGTLVALAVLQRRKSQDHKRLMLLATTALMAAPASRLPFDFLDSMTATFALSDVPIALILAHDVLARGRPHRATVGGGLFIVVSQA